MDTIAVRIPREAHAEIRRMAKERHQTVGRVVSEMVAEQKRNEFRERFRSSVERSMDDPDIQRELQEEQRVYDLALLDGLEGEIGC